MGEKKSALIIANFRYEDPVLRQLVAPAQDAEALARALQDPAIGGFEVLTCLNQPWYTVSEKIEAFFAERKRDDLLLLYFSGHGVKDEDGKLYFAAVNTKCKLLRATAVGANFVNDVMLRSRSRRQVLLLDCCYSGAFARGMIAKGNTEIGTKDHFEGRGRVVLTASDAMQYSFEGESVDGKGVRSVFTRTLVQGLETGEADLDGDGSISLDELYEYVHGRVTDETPQQRPVKWAFDVQGEIVIARNPRPVVEPAKLPPELLDGIESAFPSAREEAVRELDRLLRGKHKGLALAAHAALSKLREDDSRRVSSAAEKCFRTYAETQRVWEEETSREKAEREREGREESERGQVARTEAEAERLAVAKAVTERAAWEEADRARLATKRVISENPEPRETGLRAIGESAVVSMVPGVALALAEFPFLPNFPSNLYAEGTVREMNFGAFLCNDVFICLCAALLIWFAVWRRLLPRRALAWAAGWSVFCGLAVATSVEAYNNFFIWHGDQEDFLLHGLVTAGVSGFSLTLGFYHKASFPKTGDGLRP